MKNGGKLMQGVVVTTAFLIAAGTAQARLLTDTDGDGVGDGDVDALDLGILAGEFGRTQCRRAL